jgi:hypothetical protein
MVAGASVEEAFTAAASVAVVFEVEAFTAVLSVEAFEVGVFAVVLTLLALVVMAFAAVGSIAASTIGSPLLVILGTRSFTIPIHTTGTIPIAIILAIILMVTDTAALAAAALAAAGFVAAGFMAVAFAAVGDPYNQSVYQGSLDTPTSWLDKFSSVWLSTVTARSYYL